MNITAANVKDLRTRTGAGMMDCKKALTEAKGDLEVAIDILRKSGVVKAAKRSGKVAIEGVVVIAETEDRKRGAILELNSETDFVARSDEFKTFANQLAKIALENNISDVNTLLSHTFNEMTVAQEQDNLRVKVGENIGIRRLTLLKADHGGIIGGYTHHNRIAVLVALSHPSIELAKEIAMHIAAMNPVAVSEVDISKTLLDREKKLFTEQAAESGKPDHIIVKMVEGRVKKFLKENCLVGQPFVKDTERTVGNLLEAEKTKVLNFVRYEVGEGIEKQEKSFVEEVKEQLS